MSTVDVVQGDSREVLTTLADGSIASVVTDPPYSLVSIQKRFGKPGSTAAKGGVYNRSARGFMGKRWDNGETAFDPAFWSEVWRVLKPGGHVLAFGGTRTFHRLVCAIEDGGFEIRDSIGWLFGSGFPKSHNAGNGWGTALKPAMELICVARKPLIGTVAANVLEHGTGAINIDGCRVGATKDVPASGSAHRLMNGFGFGAERGDTSGHDPNVGRWPANVVHDGSDEVVKAFPEQTSGGTPPSRPRDKTRHTYGAFGGQENPNGIGSTAGTAARFFFQSKPDAPKCCLCSVNFAAAQSPTDDTQTGNTVLLDAQDSPPRESAGKRNPSSRIAKAAAGHSGECRPPLGDSVLSNAEAWPLSRIARNVLAAASLCASCGTDIARVLAEVRRTGSEALSRSSFSIPDYKETILRRCLASYVASRESTDTILTTTSLSILLGSVFHAIAESTKSERVGSAASTKPGSKRLWYSAKADSSDRLGSKHPTVKPVDLMRWLVRLVTPKGGLVLDPFAGSGTTGMACMAEGFDCILIEREAEYVADIRRRLAHVHGDDTPLFARAAE